MNTLPELPPVADMTFRELNELERLLAERDMLRAFERGPDAKRAWLEGQRDKVAVLLAEMDAELKKLP
jgi:hypothetical protein